MNLLERWFNSSCETKDGEPRIAGLKIPNIRLQKIKGHTLSNIPDHLF